MAYMHSARAFAALAIAACGASPATPARAPAAAGLIRLALADDRAVRFAVVEDGKIRVERTVATPGTIVQLDWVGDDPVVRLGSTPMRFANGEPVATPPDDPALIGVIARITARGYEPFPRLPEATWRDVQPKPEQEKMEDWGLISSTDGSIWQGYCGNAFTADGRTICELLYARVSPAPVITSKSPPLARDAEVFTVAAPAEPTLEVVRVPRSNEDDGNEHFDDTNLLRCRDRGTTVELPKPSARNSDFLGVAQLTWLSADPPLFRVAAAFAGFDVYFSWMVVERCREASEYGTQIVAGPDGTVALFDDRSLVVLHRGRIVGRASTGASFVRFAPR
jgi:hypothetical protein